MKPRNILKLVLDLGMTAAMVVLMAYSLLGEALHEWLGLAAIAAFVAHHLLNGWWHKSLLRGRYNPLRLAGLVVNCLLLVCMAALAVSGVILSQHAFTFLPIHGFTAFARTAHLLGSYWGFVLVAVHLGLHFDMVCAMVRKALHLSPAAHRWPGQLAGLALAAYGAYTFWQNRIADYLFLRTQFVFIDFSLPFWQFACQYIAMGALFVWLAHNLAQLARKAPKKQKPAAETPAEATDR